MSTSMCSSKSCSVAALSAHSGRFFNTLTGRDKAARFIQFFSRFLALRLAQHRTPVAAKLGSAGTAAAAAVVAADDVLAERIRVLTALAAAVGLARKVFRSGKFFEYGAGAIDAAPSAFNALVTVLTRIRRGDFNAARSPAIVPLLSAIKSACFTAWMFTDTMAVLLASNVVKRDNHPTWPEHIRRGTRCWLMGIIAGLTADAIKLSQVNERILAATAAGPRDDKTASTTDALVKQRAALHFSITQQGIDALLPMGILGVCGVSESLGALAGAITAIMGGYTQWLATA